MTVGVEKIDVAMPAAEVKIAGRRRRGRSWRSDEAGPAASEVAA